MSTCRYCGLGIEWAREGQRWLPLVPLGEEGILDRTHIDAYGRTRSKHSLVCSGPLQVTRLASPIPAVQVHYPNVDTQTGEIPAPKPGANEFIGPFPEPKPKRKRQKRKSWAVEAGLGLNLGKR